VFAIAEKEKSLRIKNRGTMERCIKMLIRNKQHFYELAAKGLCGNTAKTWPSIKDYLRDSEEFPFAGIRLMKYGANGGATPKQPAPVLAKWVRSHALSEGEYIVSAVPRRDRGPGLQGELSFSRITGEWCLYFSEKRGYQRKILSEEGQYLIGFPALLKLRQWLPSYEVDELLELHDLYSDGHANYPTIEFAQTDRIGWNPNREALIWEIRHR
jgi:hypothetical protein